MAKFDFNVLGGGRDDDDDGVAARCYNSGKRGSIGLARLNSEYITQTEHGHNLNVRLGVVEGAISQYVPLCPPEHVHDSTPPLFSHTPKPSEHPHSNPATVTPP